MIKKLISLCVLLLFTTASMAQDAASNKFADFAYEQDTLMVNAYTKRDTATYSKLLTEFLVKYKKLSPQARKRFSGNLNGAYYNFACIWSLLNNKKKALEYLEKSIKSGYSDYGHLLEDEDLNNIKNEPKFLKLANQVRGIGDYVYILKKAGTYNNNDARPVPAFIYQSGDNPHLVTLRKSMKLDSVAGNGNEISRMLRLMYWLHDLVPHDGQHENPEVKNAMAMISLCKKTDRGLNCRGLATVLNECYLAMGFKSRIVTCMPKDSLKKDPDCHVINVVYSDSLKKWLWIDPTNEAYVMDGNGIMLSVSEVRKRLVNGQPLAINGDANWNHKTMVKKENYLYQYMAKNLYLLECPVSSEYNMETGHTGKLIQYNLLVPVDHFVQKPDKTVSRSSSKTLVTYKTNNEQKFWAPPY